jgi:phosphatidylserine/phosphatidylglycerophosphate/cardiolipin synthase-like enzyme
MEALFTSIVGGNALRSRILAAIAEAAALAARQKVDLHVMTFAFTDQDIADALGEAAVHRPLLTIRILADWSQRLIGKGQQVGRLSLLRLPNLQVRYKKDQPYVWDPGLAHMRWSYHASWGLLHHKTLAVLVGGRPWRLICGSFNWTATAARSYENLLIINPDGACSLDLMSRVELEFEALWSDGRATLSPADAQRHYRAILEEYRADPMIAPSAIAGLTQSDDQVLRILDQACYPIEQREDTTRPEDSPANARHSIAFAFRDPQKDRAQGGHAEANRNQRLSLCTPSAKIKRVPLTLTNLALDSIFRAAPGDTLKVAMYGISTRVPEYGALLDAARRGVRVSMLLDRGVGFDVAERLDVVRAAEDLPIEIRTARKTMHQKYVIHLESVTVLTGTANMSTDASSRHLEHRIRVVGCAKLAAQYCADFDRIWERLSVNYQKTAG